LAVPATLVQRSLARDLIAALDRAPVSAKPLPEVVAQLPALLDAEQACAFLVRSEGGIHRLEFFHGARMPAGIKPAFERWLPDAPKRFAAYDPARPDPRQRNLALRSRDVLALTGVTAPAVNRSFLPRFALSESDQLRVLVCEGPSLLAWVGALRARPFSRDEQRLLAALTPALQRRLALERRMSEAERLAGEIGGALEEVPAAAFVLGGAGAVLHANAAGRALFQRDRRAVEDRLATALKGNCPGVQVARLSADGELRLAILMTPGDPAPLVELARLHWRLTPRQAQVLQLVARGMSNRAVAAQLTCAESTVELHVTALLEKSGCESRARLVARLWSGA
jgi:DNA-binding CsgD family transcriptional regulator